MKLENFEKILNEYRKSQNMISELYSIGFDLLEGKYKLDESIYNLFIASLDSHYTDIGVDWVIWFIFENEWGEREWNNLPLYKRNEDGVMILDTETTRHGANDEHGNPICYDIKSLWECIEKDYKL